MDITPDRSVVLELKDEHRAMHEGYVFLRREMPAACRRDACASSRTTKNSRAFAVTWTLPRPCRPPSRHGLEGLQTYPPGTFEARWYGAFRAR
jgi:hypothetical protein